MYVVVVEACTVFVTDCIDLSHGVHRDWSVLRPWTNHARPHRKNEEFNLKSFEATTMITTRKDCTIIAPRSSSNRTNNPLSDPIQILS